MPERRQTGVWIAGVLSLGVVAGLAIGGYRWVNRKPVARPIAVKLDANSPLAVLAPALRDGDAKALTALYEQVSANKPGINEDETPQWLDTLAAVRAGYRKYGSYGRATALNVATKILNRFSVSSEGAPASWPKVLPPVHDILASGMADADLNVRVSALSEVSRLWGWLPGRAPTPVEEDLLADWKLGLHTPVVRALADRAPKVRLAAVACLGTLPINSAAAPAIPYLEDMSQGAGEVRRQVMISFAARRALLTEESLLKRLYDPEPGVPETAEAILKTRGLTDEQISLGKMIYHPKPALRVSVIPLLRDRTDIDPVVWFLQLTRDSDPSVRASAVEALAGRLSPEVRERLAEMASSDQSPQVRQAASKIVPAATEKTVALPPCPAPRAWPPRRTEPGSGRDESTGSESFRERWRPDRGIGPPSFFFMGWKVGQELSLALLARHSGGQRDREHGTLASTEVPDQHLRRCRRRGDDLQPGETRNLLKNRIGRSSCPQLAESSVGHDDFRDSVAEQLEPVPVSVPV
ncbi:HEAT repeat-containing protein [Singulisphaera sp. GP187]|uniref:HEAT repeat domain-containing protein n=1 Tax=Singulisphaera sp. GP187 TaxID=1882752 RepID=UPI00092B7C9B|nr:HEAT repeat domain-containing protein [Singulisphaera sp. GP187]SIO66675.1 HEAT repeat-containing protein [Singulisphaera sp. GP187]